MTTSRDIADTREGAGLSSPKPTDPQSPNQGARVQALEGATDVIAKELRDQYGLSPVVAEEWARGIVAALSEGEGA